MTRDDSLWSQAAQARKELPKSQPVAHEDAIIDRRIDAIHRRRPDGRRERKLVAAVGRVGAGRPVPEEVADDEDGAFAGLLLDENCLVEEGRGRDEERRHGVEGRQRGVRVARGAEDVCVEGPVWPALNAVRWPEDCCGRKGRRGVEDEVDVLVVRDDDDGDGADSSNGGGEDGRDGERGVGEKFSG